MASKGSPTFTSSRLDPRLAQAFQELLVDQADAVVEVLDVRVGRGRGSVRSCPPRAAVPAAASFRPGSPPAGFPGPRGSCGWRNRPAGGGACPCCSASCFSSSAMRCLALNRLASILHGTRPAPGAPASGVDSATSSARAWRSLTFSNSSRSSSRSAPPPGGLLRMAGSRVWGSAFHSLNVSIYNLLLWMHQALEGSCRWISSDHHARLPTSFT